MTTLPRDVIAEITFNETLLPLSDASIAELETAFLMLINELRKGWHLHVDRVRVLDPGAMPEQRL